MNNDVEELRAEVAALKAERFGLQHRASVAEIFAEKSEIEAAALRTLNDALKARLNVRFDPISRINIDALDVAAVDISILQRKYDAVIRVVHVINEKLGCAGYPPGDCDVAIALISNVVIERDALKTQIAELKGLQT